LVKACPIPTVGPPKLPGPAPRIKKERPRRLVEIKKEVKAVKKMTTSPGRKKNHKVARSKQQKDITRGGPTQAAARGKGGGGRKIFPLGQEAK